MSSTTETLTTGAAPSVLRLQQGITRKVLPASSSQKSFTSIPTIDVSGIFSSDLAERHAVADAVRDACTTVGFMQIAGHGIDWDIVEDAFKASQEFFDLPVDEKMKLHQHSNPHFLGYEPLYETNVNMLKKGDCKEAFSFGYDRSNDPCTTSKTREVPDLLVKISRWPESAILPTYQARMQAYQAALLKFSRAFVRTFALALHLPEDYFDKKVTYPMATIRTLHYPPMKGREDEETGLGAHTDIELFTLIASTPTPNPSLYVLSASGSWIPLHASPGHFVVNLGDMMQRMTNNTFLSTVHRVENKGEVDRYSLPFFFGANADELIEVLPSCITEERGSEYEGGITTFEHSNKRLQVARHKHPNAKEMMVELPDSYVRKDGELIYH